jgi:hypothetical protein
MERTDNNPSENILPSGITDKQLQDAVKSSGYPLQTLVAQELSSNFRVAEEWGYKDRQTGEDRSLDVLAELKLQDSTHHRSNLTLLIECKRADLPFVFFKKALQHVPRDFPAITGLMGKTLYLYNNLGQSREISATEFMRLKDFPFIGNGPPVCSSLARAERAGQRIDLSGDQPYKQIILPLISALHHVDEFHKKMGTASQARINSAHCIGLLDAPMLIAEGDPDSPSLTLCPWVRVVRQEAVQEKSMSYMHYVVDFVNRYFLSTFIDAHVLPFSKQFANRVVKLDNLLHAGKASAPHFENWSVDDLKPWG